MRTQVHAKNASSSSAEIDSIDSSSSDTSSDESNLVRGDYAEGRAPGPADSTPAETHIVPLCPAPLRITVGVFSALNAVAGIALLVAGGNAINSPNDPQADLHRVMVGAGAAMLGLGFVGMLSTRLTQEQAGPHAATA